jgi:hypothetical protein
MRFREALKVWSEFIDYVLSADFDSKPYPDDKFRCQAPARVTYYNSTTRPRSRQRGEGIEAVRSYIDGR